MIGGNVSPAVGSDAYLHPNSHSDNLGNEDIIECHNPQGVWDVNPRPIYPGYGTNPNNQNRVPGGIYDDGAWQGTPTGVIALYGPGGDDIAVLNSQQYTYVSAGDSQNPWTGGNYSSYALDRKNIDATTGATICLKGLYSQILPQTTGQILLYAHGCDGQTYFASDSFFRGWTSTGQPAYTEVAGGWGVFDSLNSSHQVLIQAYRVFLTLGAMPNGDIPTHVGIGYATATGQRIYSFGNTWQWLDISYPESGDPASTLGRIEDGSHFRGSTEFFVWQSFGRVYSYKM